MELLGLPVLGCHSACAFNFDPESSHDAISSAPDQQTDSTGPCFSIGHHLANSEAKKASVYHLLHSWSIKLLLHIVCLFIVLLSCLFTFWQ